VAHTYNPSYSGQEAEIMRVAVRGQPGQIVLETLSQKYPARTHAHTHMHTHTDTDTQTHTHKGLVAQEVHTALA
jgi:hypothetical protein